MIEATLGTGVNQAEGAYAGVLAAADVVCTSMIAALDLLRRPLLRRRHCRPGDAAYRSIWTPGVTNGDSALD